MCEVATSTCAGSNRIENFIWCLSCLALNLVCTQGIIIDPSGVMQYDLFGEVMTDLSLVVSIIATLSLGVSSIAALSLVVSHITTLGLLLYLY